MARADPGERIVRHALPYADTSALAPEVLAQKLGRGLPLEFGHRLADQLGGQLDAGFVLTALYEDRHRTDAPAHVTPT